MKAPRSGGLCLLALADLSPGMFLHQAQASHAYALTVVTVFDSMTQNNERLLAGLADLQRVEGIADELHAGCCQPLRSPRMKTLSATLRSAHEALTELEGDSEAGARVVALLEDAGAQLGHLQVACCTPARTKLYAEALDGLGRTQRLIKRTLDLDH